MVELLYGLYKKQTIEQIMYTFISSVVIYGYGSFENEKLIVDSNEFPKRISKILCGIDHKNNNSIKWKDVVDLKDYFIQLLSKHGYVSKIPLIGYIRSRRFHRTMKVEILSINEYIRLYIDKEDKNYLDDIDPRIKGISFSFPRYDGFGSFYKDSIDIIQEHMAIRNGTNDANRYKEYYTVGGQKRKIN